MLIREIRLENLLSFGPESPALALGPLNVLIGPNGSGKSNLIDALSLLQAAPLELAKPVWTGSGIREWLWKGASNPIATIEALIENPH
jgi:predicted ATPase